MSRVTVTQEESLFEYHTAGHLIAEAERLAAEAGFARITAATALIGASEALAHSVRERGLREGGLQEAIDRLNHGAVTARLATVKLSSPEVAAAIGADVRLPNGLEAAIEELIDPLRDDLADYAATETLSDASTVLGRMRIDAMRLLYWIDGVQRNADRHAEIGARVMPEGLAGLLDMLRGAGVEVDEIELRDPARSLATVEG
jgi:hypothetical protein